MKFKGKRTMNDEQEIIYSINIEDVQNVAKEELDRVLTTEEMRLIGDRIGNYINWYQAINLSINEVVKKA